MLVKALDSSLQIKWDDTNQLKQFHIYEIEMQSNMQNWCSVQKSDRPACQIDNLTENNQYRFRVKILNTELGYSGPCSPESDTMTVARVNNVKTVIKAYVFDHYFRACNFP